MVKESNAHMVLVDEFSFHKECKIKKCKNNLNGGCRLKTTIFENGICMDNTALKEDSRVEIRLFNHRNNKAHYQKLTVLQLYLIDRILKNENGGI